jgi:hypothetical protein
MMKKPKEVRAMVTTGLTDETRASLRATMNPEALAMAGALEGAEEAPPADFPPEVEKRLAKNLDVGREAEALARQWSAEQFECARMIGQMQTLKAFADFSTAGYIRLFQHVKEAKAYRGLSVPLPDGSTRVINSFADFCELMGTSRSKVDEDLDLAAKFGEAFFESAKTAGISYRDLRALRAAPEDVREEAKKLSDDPEALKILIDEQGAQNTKLRKSLEEKNKTLEAREKLLAEKNKALDDVKTELNKLKSLSVEDREQLAAAKHAEARKAVLDAGNIFIGAGLKFFNTLQAALELDTPEMKMPPQLYEDLEGEADLIAGTLADLFANRLDWKIDFERKVYPEWMTKALGVSEDDPETPETAEDVQ